MSTEISTKATANRRFNADEQATMLEVLEKAPGGKLGPGPSKEDLNTLAKTLGDTVERVTSWIARARSTARSEHASAVAAKRRKEAEEKDAREQEKKRKTEAEAEAVRKEKRRQLEFF